MKVGITGCFGRMGSLLVNEILSGEWKDMELAGGSDLTVRADAGFFVTDDPDILFEKSDTVIDFSIPDATRKNTWLAAKHKTRYVVGTTGLTQEDEQELRDAALETPIVYAANMSIGVNILLALVEDAARRLTADGWDIEIFESHHKHKIDAPSGTALAMGKAAAAGRDVYLEDVAAYARHGETGARKQGDIGFSVARGGDVVGEHTAYFYGEGERIELTHVATNRALFAKGALRAATWLGTQKPGLYTMRDVLSL